MVCADLFYFLPDSPSIDFLWLLARQAQQQRPVRGVSVSSQRQRSKQFDLPPNNSAQQFPILQIQTKPPCRPHRSNRMRTRRTNTDLENLKDAGFQFAP